MYFLWRGKPPPPPVPLPLKIIKFPPPNFSNKEHVIRYILKNNKSERDSLNFEGKSMSGERRGVIFLDLFNVSDYLEQFRFLCCCCGKIIYFDGWGYNPPPPPPTLHHGKSSKDSM